VETNGVAASTTQLDEGVVVESATVGPASDGVGGRPSGPDWEAGEFVPVGSAASGSGSAPAGSSLSAGSGTAASGATLLLFCVLAPILVTLARGKLYFLHDRMPKLGSLPGPVLDRPG
jgi:hypothetical protein